MNYTKIYNDLVERGKNRTLNCYFETHHIVPRCMGGSNNIDNLVDLTPEEHYVAHQLLVKIYPKNNKLIYGLHVMGAKGTSGKRNNKRYGWVRRVCSENQKGKKCSEEQKRKNSEWHKGKVLSQETKDKMSLNNCNNDPEVRRKKSIALKGRIITREVKKKMSDKKKKLSQEQANEIREIYATKKYSSRALGLTYNVDAQTIMNIVNNKFYI